MKDELEGWQLKRRWKFTYWWAGWRRALWLAFQLDLAGPCICVVVFGVVLMWGKQIVYDEAINTETVKPNTPSIR